MADEPRPVSRRARRETSGRSDAPTGEEGRAPEIQAGLAYTSEMQTTQLNAAAAAGAVSVEPSPPQSTMSRRDRRRLERLENPVETWTAAEEMRHTGQVPVMTPEVISQQEALARQQAAAAQSDAQAASGSVRQVNSPPAPHQGGPPAQQAPKHPQQLQAAPQPGGPRPIPMPPHPGHLVVPQLAGEPSVVGPPPAYQTSPPPMTLGEHAAGFEQLVSGGVTPPQPEMPAAPVPQNGDPFQPPGIAPPGGVAPPPGQGLVIPGTGMIQNNMGLNQATGALRTIPGTGTFPRPIVEIQPAGGVRHFGWAQLGLLAAAAFALGVVIWNVAAHGS